MAHSGWTLAALGMVLLGAAAPLASAAPACPPHQYLENNTCEKCVSKNSPFHETLTGNNGHKCYFQETDASETGCTPTNIPVKIRSADPTKTARCINPNNKEHTIIFPLSNSMLPGMTYRNYKKATLRLQGLKTRKTKMGRTAYTLKTSGATKGLAITFVDNYGILKKRAGLSIELVGVVSHSGGLDRCFVSNPVVCPIR